MAIEIFLQCKAAGVTGGKSAFEGSKVSFPMFAERNH